MLFTAFLLIHSFPTWRSAHRDSVENKLAGLLVVFMCMALNGTPPSLCGRQITHCGLYIHLPAQTSQQLAQTTKKKKYDLQPEI